MNMTFATRSVAADDIYDLFMAAVTDSRHDVAILLAMQATAEAAEQMKCILVNAQLRASEHSSSARLVYIATRRQAQSDELRVFLRSTIASPRPPGFATRSPAGPQRPGSTLFPDGSPRSTPTWLNPIRSRKQLRQLFHTRCLSQPSLPDSQPRQATRHALPRRLLSPILAGAPAAAAGRAAAGATAAQLRPDKPGRLASASSSGTSRASPTSWETPSASSAPPPVRSASAGIISTASAHRSGEPAAHLYRASATTVSA
jgi:hypothetical protein